MTPPPMQCGSFGGDTPLERCPTQSRASVHGTSPSGGSLLVAQKQQLRLRVGTMYPGGGRDRISAPSICGDSRPKQSNPYDKTEGPPAPSLAALGLPDPLEFDLGLSAMRSGSNREVQSAGYRIASGGGLNCRMAG